MIMKRRLVVFMNSYTNGISGGDVCLIELAKRMDAYQALVITSALGKKLCEENELKAAYCLTTNESRFKRVIGTYFLRIINSFFLRLKISNLDILYAGSDFLTDVIPAFIKKLHYRKVKWVQKIFHVIPANRPISHYAQRISFFLVRHFADTVIVDNSSLKNELVRRNFKPDNIYINYPGIDIDYYRSSGNAAENSEAVFLGRFHSSKGLFDLVEIWRLVHEKIPQAKLTVIGGGNKFLRGKLEKKIGEAGLADRIILVGHLQRQKMVEMMKAAELFVFPSHEEGFGIAILEAMACGLPVVAWDLPVYKEIFQRHIMQIKENDLQAFSNAIIELLEDSRKRRRISEAGYDYIKRYSWDNAVKRELEIIGY